MNAASLRMHLVPRARLCFPLVLLSLVGAVACAPAGDCRDDDDCGEGERCVNTDGVRSCRVVAVPGCGNGTVEEGEACDDGGDGDLFDGCDDACRVPHFSPSVLAGAPVATTLVTESLSSLAVDDDGVLYVGELSGVLRLDGDRLTRVSRPFYEERTVVSPSNIIARGGGATASLVVSTPVLLTLGAGGLAQSAFPYADDGSVQGFVAGPLLMTQPPGVRGIRGLFYVPDERDDVIVRIRGGNAERFAGGGDGTAEGTDRLEVDFDRLASIAALGDDSLLLSEFDRPRLRRVFADGSVRTVAGADDAGFVDGAGDAARFVDTPRVTVDNRGIAWIADGPYVRRFDPSTNTVTTVAGDGRRSVGGEGAANALGFSPTVVVAHDDTIYVAERDTGLVRRIVDGQVATVVGRPLRESRASSVLDGNISPTAVAFDGDDLIVAAASEILRIRPDGGVSQLVDGRDKTQPCSTFAVNGFEIPVPLANALAVLPSGDVAFANAAEHRVCVVDALTGVVSVLAGTGVPGNDGDSGPAAEAQLENPTGLAVLDNPSRLVVADAAHHVLRSVDLESRTISRYAGTGTAGFSAGAREGGDVTVGPLASDGADLYLFGGGRVVRITETNIEHLAGNGTDVDPVPGPALQAGLPLITGGCFDGTDLWVVENGRLSRLSSGLLTFVTDYGQPYFGSLFGSLPDVASSDVVACRAGELLFTDLFGVRRVDLESQRVTGIATPGYGVQGGDASRARFYIPGSVGCSGFGCVVRDSGSVAFPFIDDVLLVPPQPELVVALAIDDAGILVARRFDNIIHRMQIDGALSPAFTARGAVDALGAGDGLLLAATFDGIEVWQNGQPADRLPIRTTGPIAVRDENTVLCANGTLLLQAPRGDGEVIPDLSQGRIEGSIRGLTSVNRHVFILDEEKLIHVDQDNVVRIATLGELGIHRGCGSGVAVRDADAGELLVSDACSGRLVRLAPEP